MKRPSSFALIFALVASLVVALSGPLAARADSQAGGLPAVADRVSALEAAVTSLQIANTNLQNALNAETAARAAADSGLQSALNAESAARTAGDSGLQSALNAESAARTAGDSGLQSALNAESAARAAGDSALQAAISTAKAKAYQTSVPTFGLVNGAFATVATLGPLPPGKYFVIAKATVINLNHDATWVCDLDLDNANLDQTREGTDESTLTDSTVAGTSNGNLTNISLATVFPPAGTVRMKCHTDVNSSDLRDIRIIAIEVGDFTNL